MIEILSWLAFLFGSLLCVCNFYLSFLRYPFHRLRGLPRESYRFVSGIPLIGSALVALAMCKLYAFPSVRFVGLILIAIDTGGIHWFLGTITYQHLREKLKR